MPRVWEKVGAENLVRHRSGNYYLQAMVGGKKIRRGLKTTDIRIAKMKRDQILTTLRSVLPGASDRIKTLGDALLIVEGTETNKPHLKPRTREYYSELFRILKETLPLARAAHVFTNDDAKRWWAETAGKRSPTQANNLLRLLRHSIAEIRKAGLRHDDPCERLVRMKVRQSAVDSLPSREHFEAIVSRMRSTQKAHSKRAALHCEFLAWSGCRFGEARAVLKTDVLGEWLRITGPEGGTKGGEPRMLPINPTLRRVIDELLALDPDGPNLLTLSRPRDALKNACAHLKLPHMRIHDLRHLFATMAIESGVDIPTLARWLGHKDRGITLMRVYGHLRDQHSLSAAQKMG